MIREEIIPRLSSAKLLFIVVMMASMFASVDSQQAYAEDSDGDHHSYDCKDQHSKCSQKDGTPFLLPFP
jgi:hypothetical protein